MLCRDIIVDMERQTKLAVANIVPCTEAEGPGKRFALWLQGCPLHCPGCCNPEMIPFEGGTLREIQDLSDEIQQSHRTHDIEGITLLGGEPLAHAVGVSELMARVQELGLSVMIFSGYTLSEIQQLPTPVDQILEQTDILVDGRYEATQPDTSRRWIGSRNQNIHFLSDRYVAHDPVWRQPDTLEVRWENGELSINGFPAKQNAPLWTGRLFERKRD